jgi:hypothetical protein
MPSPDDLNPGYETSPSLNEDDTSTSSLLNLNPVMTGTSPRTSKGDNGYATQQSFSTYVFTGPFMLGQSLKNNGAGLNTSVLLGSLVNLTVLGWMINVATQRATPMDPFGPFVAGVAQVGAGILMVPLATSKA